MILFSTSTFPITCSTSPPSALVGNAYPPIIASRNLRDVSPLSFLVAGVLYGTTNAPPLAILDPTHSKP